MAGAAAFLIGRDHPHVIGDGQRYLLEQCYARRMDAIVIGDENTEMGVRFTHGRQYNGFMLGAVARRAVRSQHRFVRAGQGFSTHA